jgi:very-long-chain (3R)-3-hydroxyacyl-CoA dehydratase
VVRAPVATTALQVASRLLLVWGVVEAVPAVGRSPFYSSMLVAWAVTEVVRYSFFVMNLQGDVPAPLAWLRYNTFFVLYPVGIASELALVAQAGLALGRWWLWAAVVIAAIYVPGEFGRSRGVG